jgi:hypothetical protein
MSSARPADLLDHEIPDLELPCSEGGALRFRGRVGLGPLVLFFYVRNASPG